MLSKDELVERMADAIRIVNLYGNADGHEYLEGSRRIAEAALDALLGSLPEITGDGYQNKHDMYYRQLLGMKDKEKGTKITNGTFSSSGDNSFTLGNK